jgi:uncharacterized protein
MKSKVLVLGASTNKERYSYLATERLLRHGFEPVLVSNRVGEVLGLPIHKQWPNDSLETVTLYIGAKNQGMYYNHILKGGYKRVIFNPGTENEEFETMLQDAGIEALRACTLVMLATGQF